MDAAAGTTDPGFEDEVAVYLRGVLKKEAIPRWWKTPIPALGGRTPDEALGDGDSEAVMAVAVSYWDPSFS